MPSRTQYLIRHLCQVVCGATLLLLSPVGCQTLPVPSARFATVTSRPDKPDLTLATRVPDAVMTDVASGEELESALVDAAPNIGAQRPAELPTNPHVPRRSEPPRPAQSPQQPLYLTAQSTAHPQSPQSLELKPVPIHVPHSLEQNSSGTVSERIPVIPATSPRLCTPAVTCDLPLRGLCGCEPCPPLFVLPKGKWRCCLGPLFCHHQPEELAQMAEAELQAPHSLFHPVPTAPVFASRYDYAPPQLMLVPVKQPRLVTSHATPQTLPPLTEMGPLTPLTPGPFQTSENGNDSEVIPIPDGSPPVPTTSSQHPSTDPFSPSAQRSVSVLKRQ